MAMNPNHVDYRSPSRLERLESRRHREKVGDALTSALEQLQYIRAAGNPSAHHDPHEHVEKLKELSGHVFSTIPPEFCERAQPSGRSKSAQQAESKVKLLIGSSPAKSNNSVNSNGGIPAADAHLAIVDKERPLRLSYEALRASGKLPKSNASSSYAGLFSQNAALCPGVEQGPVPDIYVSKPNNKRKVLEERRRRIKEQTINGDRNRKAKLLEPKPLKLLGNKVTKDFIPSAAAELPVGTRRQEVEERKRQSTATAVVTKAFK